MIYCCEFSFQNNYDATLLIFLFEFIETLLFPASILSKQRWEVKFSKKTRDIIDLNTGKILGGFRRSVDVVRCLNRL